MAGALHLHSVKFEPDPSRSAILPTEIYVPARRHYPEGWSLSGCDEAAGCRSRWNAETEILEILTPNQTARVELQITPDVQTPATIR